MAEFHMMGTLMCGVKWGNTHECSKPLGHSGPHFCMHCLTPRFGPEEMVIVIREVTVTQGEAKRIQCEAIMPDGSLIPLARIRCGCGGYHARIELAPLEPSGELYTHAFWCPTDKHLAYVGLRQFGLIIGEENLSEGY